MLTRHARAARAGGVNPVTDDSAPDFRQTGGMSGFSFFLLAVSASLALSLLPGGKYVLYPFRLFTTWAHECSHGLMAKLTGGEVRRITLSPDTSGLCVYQAPRGRIRQGLVASAGYVGSCVIGCAIYLVTVLPDRHASIAMTSLGVLMIVSFVFWVRNGFGMLITLLLGLGFLTLGQGVHAHPVPPALLQKGLSFLGIQTALQALFDLRELFKVEGKSDAHTMQRLFWLPAPFWACLWIAMSGALFVYLVRRLHGF